MPTSHKPDDPKSLHITINRRAFTDADGVQSSMTGAQLAALVDVPAENAVIRLENGPNPRPIEVTETISIQNGNKFAITRKTVQGGHA
jgi:hypothetical protein